MFDILFARTFIIVGVMLLITAITSRINKTFETTKEMIFSVIGSFLSLMLVMFFADSYPINLFLVAVFSVVTGWNIGPTIEYIGKMFVLRKYLKRRGIVLKKGEKITDEQIEEFERFLQGEGSVETEQSQREWNNVVSQAMFSTAFATLSAAGLAFFTNIDFSFLGGFLSIALAMLVIMTLLNIFFFRSEVFSLFLSYIGALLFTLYLIFDFNRLEKMAGDDSWATAIDISVSLYLDIINLFLDLLHILASAD